MSRAPQRRTARRTAGSAKGFGIVELLVALAVGLALTLAISLMLIRHDGLRRSLTSTNDAQLNASYVSYVLDRHLRSAGSGLTQGWRSNFGCLLHVSRSGAQVLPRGSAFPAPFAAVPQQVRLAPLLIHAGAGTGGSDVLAVMTGASGLGEAALRVLPGSVTTNALRVPATVGMRSADLVLVAETGLGCMMQQLTTPFAGGATQQLNFAGNFAAGTINSLPLSNFSTGGTALLSPLGNPGGNPPAFQLIGLGANSTLVTLDMLRLNGTDAALPMAEGVIELRARYGVDTNGDGQIDTWFAGSAAGYTPAELTDGSAAAQQRLLSIMAIRVGLVLRADRIEKDNVAPASLTLFDDLGAGLKHTRAISASDQRIRHRMLEVTVPLRNVMHAGRT
ncbi:MAG: PilW family protein [Rubrivivax sp.]|nr:PilW family protein [Rubrivivax sp.]